jgi:hypothetical protein
MSISNANGAASVLSPNAIINGAFDFWQRGTTSSPGGGEAYGPDRFYAQGLTAVTQGVFSSSDVSPIPGVLNYARLSRASNVGNYPSFGQRVENVQTFSGQTVTFSFYARSSSAFNAGNWQWDWAQYFGSGGSSTVANYTAGIFTPTSSWQRFMFTITLPPVDSMTIGTSSFLIFGVRNDATTASSGQLDITGIQLEQGSIATPFKRNAPSIAAELAACQRFYWRRTGGNYGIGHYYTTTAFYTTVQNPVPMRTAPTYSVGNAAAGTVFSSATGRGITATTFSFSNELQLELSITTAAATQGNGGHAAIGSSYLEVSAEL